MTDGKAACGQPRMCPEETFADRIKTEKLSLDAPPASFLVHQPPDR